VLVDGEIDGHLGVVSPLLEELSQGGDLVRVAQVATENGELFTVVVVHDDGGEVSAHVGADVVHIELRALVGWLDQLDYHILVTNQIHR